MPFYNKGSLDSELQDWSFGIFRDFLSTILLYVRFLVKQPKFLCTLTVIAKTILEILASKITLGYSKKACIWTHSMACSGEEKEQMQTNESESKSNSRP